MLVPGIKRTRLVSATVNEDEERMPYSMSDLKAENYQLVELFDSFLRHKYYT